MSDGYDGPGWKSGGRYESGTDYLIRTGGNGRGTPTSSIPSDGEVYDGPGWKSGGRYESGTDYLIRTAGGRGQEYDPYATSRGEKPKKKAEYIPTKEELRSKKIDDDNRKTAAANKKAEAEYKQRRLDNFNAYNAKYANASLFYRLTHKNPKKGINNFSTYELEKLSGGKKR